MTKRAYKLQEFVAHASNVNCLKIGKKSSRVLVTGGEDHKVNMWAIGKPNAILSLSGHASAVESVTFDAAEVLVVAGAASGTIKLWDLEEAKIVRTLTGHRSNCISVSFHPFGEFFASGSLDTNLKIWDIRHKGCIHTYKGHTRGINTIKFSPDGRWVVSGGEDNSVKLWDLTAGKLMHDFKFHEGQIQCLDFHPHEFLLATGSADRTVKFWDLETFELIGSSGPEATGVRSMVFNPDGRTLLCAMHDSLKVLSWEPLRCHDVVDVGWSKLADLSIHEGKLLGCSFNQSCVGVWVVDLQRVAPFQVSNAPRNSALLAAKLNSVNGHQGTQQLQQGISKTNGVRPYDALDAAMKEVTIGPAKSAEVVCSIPQRTSTPVSNRATAPINTVASSQTPRKNNTTRVHAGNVVRSATRSDPAPLSLPASDAGLVDQRLPPPAKRSEETNAVRSGSMPASGRPDQINVEGLQGDAGADAIRIDTNVHPEVTTSSHRNSLNGDRSEHEVRLAPGKFRSSDEMDNPVWNEVRRHKRSSFEAHHTDSLLRGASLSQSFSGDIVVVPNRPVSSSDASTTGCLDTSKARGLIAHWERSEMSLDKERSLDIVDLPAHSGPPHLGNEGPKTLGLDINSFVPRGSQNVVEKTGSTELSDVKLIEKLMQQHHTMASIMQSRLTNMQVVRRFWMKNDVKGAVEAMSKMTDHSVLVDVLSVVMERSNVISLEICGLLLPLLSELLSSDNERHILTAMSLVLKLVKSFGTIIHATISAAPSLGVDLQAEQRLERCKVCHLELQAVSRSLTPLKRQGGEIAKAAQELSTALTEV